MQAHDGTGGREWRERTEEDAEGNTTTEKEGTQWRPGGEVVDWFRDRFGEFRAEKWAHKEVRAGRDGAGPVCKTLCACAGSQRGRGQLDGEME